MERDAMRMIMMRLCILLAIAAAAHARVVNKCDGVIIHNINHEKEVLQELDSAYQLAIDYDTNILFFSYSSSEVEVFKSGYINLKTKEFGVIPGINGGFANAVDTQRHAVYLGGRDGIYNFNFDTKTAQHIDGTNTNIWQLFYKNDLYYTSYPDEAAYVFKNGESKRVPELADTRAMLMAIDNDNNIFFANSSGLYMHKTSKGYAMHIGDYNLSGISADSDGNLYFSTPNGLYHIKSDTKTVEKIATLSEVYGMAIEADGSIIYASDTALIRLKPTKSYCYNDDKKVSSCQCM